jgi:signal transduction histidine kinase/ActR/RegA family two-component response regulator
VLAADTTVSVRGEDAGELSTLRGALRDLVALSALPLAWTERDGATIARDGLDLALSLLQANVGVARLPPVVASKGPAEITRTFRQHSPDLPALALAALDTLPSVGAYEVVTLKTPIGDVRLALAPLVVENQEGLLGVGSHRADFPTALEATLLRVAANHVAVALRAAELLRRARDADRRKDEFMALLGHELRNPLASIRGSIDLLTRTTERASDAQRTALDIIDRQSRVVARMVDDLLSVSRLSLGKLELQKEPLDLRIVARNAFGAMEMGGRFSAHGARLLLADAAIPVSGDRIRLEQVVTNLIDNALKFTPSGGTVTVSVGLEAGAPTLIVEDSGIGIAEDLIPRIFDAFVQDRASGQHGAGLGLGLALVRGVAELHGGNVGVRAGAGGRGSAFWIRLPLSADVAPERAQLIDVRVEPRRILLIDDDEDIRDALSALLELDDHEVTVAAGGVEGLNIARSDPPEVAIVDVGLPDIDGYEVVRRLRADPQTSAIVAIALTGYGKPEDARRALAAGFDVHLTKPVDRRALAAVLRSERRSLTT